MPKTSRRINVQVERRRILKNLSASIAKYPLLCVALMLFWTWLNLAFQGPLFFPPVELASGFLFSTWFAPIFAAALAYFFLGILFKRTNWVVKQSWYLGSVAALMTVGALLCFLWINLFDASLVASTSLILYITGSLAIGSGTALLMIEWGRVFGYLGPQQVLYHGIIAMLGSALLVALLSQLPRFVGQLTFVLIPIPLVFCLYRTVFSLPRKTLYNHGLNAKLKIPTKFLITALLHGVSLGVLMGWLLLVGTQASTSLLTSMSFVVAAALLLLTAVFVKMDFNHLIYQIGFGIMATGAFLIASIGWFPTLGISFQLVGFGYVHLVMWGLCAYLTKNFRLPATWVIAWPTCGLMLGQLIGGITSSILGQQDDASYWIQLLATSMVFILLMASLIMLSSRNLATGWGMASPATFVQADTTLEQVVEQLIIESNLTPREGEILGLMARGRNRKVISKELVISEETTKSHINGVYRKLSIHSQQELLTLVEELVNEHKGEDNALAFD